MLVDVGCGGLGDRCVLGVVRVGCGACWVWWVLGVVGGMLCRVYVQGQTCVVCVETTVNTYTYCVIVPLYMYTYTYTQQSTHPLHIRPCFHHIPHPHPQHRASGGDEFASVGSVASMDSVESGPDTVSNAGEHRTRSATGSALGGEGGGGATGMVWCCWVVMWGGVVWTTMWWVSNNNNGNNTRCDKQQQ